MHLIMSFEFAGLIILLAFLGIAVFQWLWNITMPQVFNLRQISFWLALRILLIAAFLTSGSFVRIRWPQ